MDHSGGGRGRGGDDNEGSYACVGEVGIQNICPSSQCFYEPPTALKPKLQNIRWMYTNKHVTEILKWK